MATIKDVAKLAGVSISTVSNYLNKKNNLSDQTGSRIQDAIDSLHYVVRNSAREMRQRTRHDIGIIFPSISDPYQEKLLTSIKGYLTQSGRSHVLELTDANPEAETHALTNMIGRNVEGIILYSCQPNNPVPFEILEESNIPYVLIDRKPDGLECNFLSVDNVDLFRRLVRALRQKGVHRIALVCGPREYQENVGAYQGYCAACEELGLYASEEDVIFTKSIRECGFRAGIRLLERAENVPQVILTTSYRLAEGIRYSFRIHHIGEANRIAIISTGDSMDDVFHQDDTIIKTSRCAFQIGEEAGHLLLENIRSPIVFDRQQLSFRDEFDLSTLRFGTSLVRVSPETFEDEIRVLILDDETSVSGLYHLLIDFYARERIKVNFLKVAPKEAFRYISEYCESGRVPERGGPIDVLLLDVPWLAMFANRGYLQPLDELIEQYGDNQSRFLTNAGHHFSLFQGKRYALPYMACTQLLFYRKDLISNKTLANDIERRYMIPLRVPNTWLHFNAIARYFTRSYNPNSPVEFGHSMASSNPDLFMCDLMPRLWEYGGGFFDRQGRISMVSSANIKATRSLLESVLYASPGLLDNKPANAVQDFISGRTAFLYTFYNYATGLVDGIHSHIVNDFSYARLPGSPVMSGWCLGISTHSKKSELAYKFIHWASGADIAIPHTILGGQSPNLMVYRNYDMVSLYPWLPLALQEFEKSRPRLPYMVSDASGRQEHVLDEDNFVNCLYRHAKPLFEQAITGHLPAMEDFHNLYAEVNREFRP